jgi:hypothetical protein
MKKLAMAFAFAAVAATAAHAATTTMKSGPTESWTVTNY